jgi:hypothetical protein
MDRNIKKYKEFIIEPNLLNETIVYYSPTVRSILNSMAKNNKVALALIQLEGTDLEEGDVTLIDMDTSDPKYISYATKSGAEKALGNNIDKIPLEGTINSDEMERIIKNLNFYYDWRDTYNIARNKLKMGRFISHLLPYKFTNDEITNFIDTYKSITSLDSLQIKLVHGGEISKWYKTENYLLLLGELKKSCMNDESDSFFEIYEKNPDVCNLVILLEGDKLLARALLWKITRLNGTNQENTYMLDRVYSISGAHDKRMHQWAMDRGYYYMDKLEGPLKRRVLHKDNNPVPGDVIIEVDIKNWNFYKYPYLDSLSYLNVYKHGGSTLTNIEITDTDEIGEIDLILELQHLDGKYDIIHSLSIYRDYVEDIFVYRKK